MAERTCSIPECDEPARARGWCRMHYVRWHRHSDPTVVIRPADRKRPPVAERFAQRYECDSDSGCWNWIGKISKQGYGVAAFSSKGHAQAHRFSYEMLVGPISVGLEIDHLCRNKRCVNPAHLEPVTHSENTRRAWADPTRRPRRRNAPAAPVIAKSQPQWFVDLIARRRRPGVREHPGTGHLPDGGK